MEWLPAEPLIIILDRHWALTGAFPCRRRQSESLWYSPPPGFLRFDGRLHRHILLVSAWNAAILTVYERCERRIPMDKYRLLTDGRDAFDEILRCCAAARHCIEV
jgi:phosphatidylserine/phosphatidylglycerophosphate/cardiolipin synthase-like enzyme